jgi:DNA-binding CsgD family transcriptional regulator/DNA-binding MarR family transcriptional regulator
MLALWRPASSDCSGMTSNALAVLGLSELAERAYRVLVGARGLDVDDLAGHLGVPPDQALRACHELAERGLANRSASGGDRFVPTAPELAIGLLTDRQEALLHQARRVAAELAGEYQRAHQGYRAEEIVQVVEGFDAIGERFDQLQRAARTEVLCFSRGPYFDARFVNETELAVLGQGIRCRAVYDRATLEIPGALPDIQQMVAAGEEARVAPRLPMKLYVADHAWGMVPLLHEAAEPYPAVVLVRSSSLLDALVALFDSVWSAAVPLTEATGGDGAVRLSPLQSRILRMMLAGSTDKNIARALDIAVRTVQRHIALLQDQAGVETRIQLVWHVAQHHWLNGTPT